MKTYLLPRSRPGRWSAWLMLSAIAVFLLLIVFAEWLRLIPDLIVSILGSAAVLAILAGGILGVIAITRKKERALAVYMAVGVMVIEMLFMAINLLSEAG